MVSTERELLSAISLEAHLLSLLNCLKVMNFLQQVIGQAHHRSFYFRYL
jgi:hypothetical protein